MTPQPGQHAPLFSSSGSLRLIATCPFCSTTYNLTGAKVLAEREDAHLLHLECVKCGSAVVALVMTNGTGVNSVGLVTDLTSEDVVKFTGTEAINTDDVLAIHEALERPGSFLEAVTTQEQ